MECPHCPSRHISKLYWIRGTGCWEHDSAISAEYFVAPEESPQEILDAKGKALWVCMRMKEVNDFQLTIVGALQQYYVCSTCLASTLR